MKMDWDKSEVFCDGFIKPNSVSFVQKELTFESLILLL